MLLLFEIMTIEWKDPNMRLHGKRHKGDRYYFRWHYGKQRVVQMAREYVDKPTEAQVSAREAFTALRREVARQLRDERLRGEWLRRFEDDNEGYKMLHTYVYAKLKAPSDSVRLDQHKKGESCVADDTETTRTSMKRGNALVSTNRTEQKFRSAEVQRFGKGCVVDGGDAINGVSILVSQEYQQDIYNCLPILGNKGDAQKGVSTGEATTERRNTITSLPRSGEPVVIVVHNGVIVPLFLPWKVRRREYWQIE